MAKKIKAGKKPLQELIGKELDNAFGKEKIRSAFLLFDLEEEEEGNIAYLLTDRTKKARIAYLPGPHREELLEILRDFLRDHAEKIG